MKRLHSSSTGYRSSRKALALVLPMLLLLTACSSTPNVGQDFRIDMEVSAMGCPGGDLLQSVQEMETNPQSRMPLPDVAATEEGVYGALTNGQRISRYLTPAIQEGLSSYAGALLKEGALPPALREMIIVRVGYASASNYEVVQHRSLASRFGVSEHKLDSLACLEPSALDADEKVAIAFVDQLLSKNRTDDAVLEAVRARHGDGATIEIIAITGLWWTLARMLTTAGVPLDVETIGSRENDITRQK